MKAAVFMGGKKFIETEFESEEQVEKLIKENYKTLFGDKTIYLDFKTKVESRSLGYSLPDGILFDFRDPENPDFYLVEIELQKHDFYNHIFRQITKFFAFFKNPKSRSDLTEKLFDIIKSDSTIEKKFEGYLGKREIYKALKDVIENNQNILLILDGNKEELQEVFETYTDTWDKMVKVEIIKQYKNNEEIILALSPDFEEIGLIEQIPQEETQEKYTEAFHLGGVEENVQLIYERIRRAMLELDSNIKINPQKYYISLRKKKNFAYLRIKKKKMRIVIMLPYEVGKKSITKHKPTQLAESVQKFYGAPCFEVVLENEENLDEIIKTLECAYQEQEKSKPPIDSNP